MMIFQGNCSNEELVAFSLYAIGIKSPENLTKKTVAIPFSRRRWKHHQIWGKEESFIEPERSMKVDPALQVIFYQVEKVWLAKWISSSGNRAHFNRLDEENFSIELGEIKPVSNYRQILEKIQIKLSLNHL